MRHAILAALFALTAAAVVAQEPSTDQQTPPAKDSKEITATVVAADPVLKTITVKKEPAMGQAGTQPETVFPVDEKAIANLKTVKAGEKVKLILKMDPASGKESVSSVEKPKTPPQP